MEKLAQDIWIFDGEAVPFLSLPFTTRMTVVRLSDDQLWIHSPIKITEQIQAQLAELGTVRFLIAPNHLHHLFLAEWQAAYPNVQCFGTDEVIKKRDDLTFDASLNDTQVWSWQDEIEQVLFSGSPLMEECVFFHKASQTLIVTDLVENFPNTSFNYWQRLVAKGVGILAPNGKMPLDWRLSFLFGKAQARQHMSQIFEWQPEVLVMAHGEIITNNAQSFLKRSFRWLI
ncbi:hypothetical protein A3K86_22210 [Photobacterium jeanii]|uniref:Methanol oxidase, glmU n=1 Tax=Photobacterium jeanii TaxID=858640 RepID=A0A178K4I6_9GAMM|nr:DUF4336 domain-containing protein [Photobacterium jeanii]OAN11632.1 hypothetical protein A3K86_22210 [Photobacterium jeanii]PST91154.1 DUF4336 domain-containing protein [Photobacterium jeanii]